VVVKNISAHPTSKPYFFYWQVMVYSATVSSRGLSIKGKAVERVETRLKPTS